MIWRVKPILVGEFGMVRDDIKFAGGNSCISSMVPSYVFLLDNKVQQIIVDTSFNSPKICSEKLGLIVKRNKDFKILLDEAGVIFDRISAIILTHLHWDHASNLAIFPQCPIYCQKRELDTAFYTDSGYDPYFLLDIRRAWSRVVPLNGSSQLMDGIRVVLLGGHTYGSQAIVVMTEDGEVVITGDTIMTYENLEKNIPVGLCVNSLQCSKALEWIRSENLEILPAHDYKTIEKSKKFWG